jgi:hypothetical protein
MKHINVMAFIDEMCHSPALAEPRRDTRHVELNTPLLWLWKSPVEHHVSTAVACRALSRTSSGFRE